MLVTLNEYLIQLEIPEQDRAIWRHMFLKDLMRGKMAGQRVGNVWMVDTDPKNTPQSTNADHNGSDQQLFEFLDEQESIADTNRVPGELTHFEIDHSFVFSKYS